MTAQDYGYRASGYRPWRRRLRWLAVLIGLPILAFTGFLVKMRLDRQALERRLQAALAELDEQDPRWRLEEIEEDLQPIPEAENSATQVQAAAKLIPSNWLSRELDWELDELEPIQQLSFPQMLNLTLTLQECEPALAEALKVNSLTRGRYVLAWTPDVIGTLMPHNQNCRDVAELLGRAAMLHSQERDFDQAWLCCHATLNVGRSIGEPERFFPLLLRIAVLSDALHGMERTLAQGEVPAAALIRTQRLLADEANQPILRLAFRGERAVIHRLFSNVEAGVVSVSTLNDAYGGYGQSTSNSKFLARISQGPVLPRVLQGHLWYLGYMGDALAALNLPPDQRRSRLAQVESTAETAPPYGRLLAYTLVKVVAVGDLLQARLECALVALAVERYRLEKHQWPEKLTDVTTAGYLSEIPLDPFDGQPLRYRIKPDHVIVYSIGEDLKDSDGTIDRLQPRGEGADIGFRLWNVDQRRQPAPPPRPDTEDEGFSP